MLKLSVAYTSFDDKAVSEDLYFNISKTELADNIDLKDEFEALEHTFTGPTRELTPSEIKQILELVKRFIKISYGMRSPDGRYFRKNDEIFADFKDRGAHDEFLWSLFTDPQNAVEFLLGVLPQDLRAEADKIAAENHPELFTDTVDVNLPVEDQEDTRPLYIREDREPTHAELREMSDAELRELYVRKTSS